MDTVGAAAVTTLMLKLAEAAVPVLSFTAAVKGNEPATVGVPEMVPDEDKLMLVGRAPFATDQVYGEVPPLAARLWL